MTGNFYIPNKDNLEAIEKRKTGSSRKAKAAYHYAQFMDAIGIDLTDEHSADTPERVAKSRINELFGGMDVDATRHLKTTFSDVEQTEGDAGFVIVDNIRVHSMCAHHHLPFLGYAHVGYIPKDRITGLSKLARVVHDYSRRPQVQEKLTNQVADTIHNELDPVATVVFIVAEHECMTCRGVREPHSKTRTTALRGKARESDIVRQEFFDALKIDGAP